jgi:hypothetical protein
LSAERCLTRCRRKRASSRSSLTRGSGSQIAGTGSRWLSVAKTSESILSVLQARGASPLTFCASAISTDHPAGLERVVDEPRSGHRLDHGADRFGVDLLDPASEGLQRVDVGWDGELVKVLSVIGEQADIEFLATEVESSVQHVKRASLVLG